MIYLREIDLTEVEKQKQKVIDMKSELHKEREKLSNMLVTLNLEYYGSAPGDYYRRIEKDYVSEDGYSVTIKKGTISIQKKLKNNLTVLWNEKLDYDTSLSYINLFFRYDSGRCIESPIVKRKKYEEYENELKRMEEILEAEKTYDPFREFHGYYSSFDFKNI